MESKDKYIRYSQSEGENRAISEEFPYYFCRPSNKKDPYVSKATERAKNQILRQIFDKGLN